MIWNREPPEAGNFHDLSLLFHSSITAPLVHAFAEMTALDLAEKVLRQLTDDFDLLGPLLLAQELPAVILKGRQIQGFAWLRHYQGLNDFALFLIGHTDDRRLGHAGAAPEYLFDFGREDQ